MHKNKLAIFLLLCSLSVAGCSKIGPGGGGTDPKPITLPAMEKSDSVNAVVFLDGTFSMAGYVNAPGSTVFVDSVKSIETTVSNVWKKEKVQFVKFGDKNQFFSNLSRDEFLSFNNARFFNATETDEEKVVEGMDMKKLNIMVTDLFQTDQHLESLMLSIKRKCLSDEANGLAIIGMKSQFDGTIYDIGRDQKSVAYKSKDKDEKSYRPFYLVVAGKENDVRAFTSAYVKKNQSARSVMFSKNIGAPYKLFAEAVTANSGKSDDKAKLMQKQDDKDGLLCYQYKIQKDGTEGKANVAVYADNVGTKVSNFKIEAQNKDFLNGKIISTGNDNKYYKTLIELRVNPVGIQYRSGEYKTTFNLIADEQAYKSACNVFGDWNIDDNAAVSNLQGVGNKTLNIKKLTDDLAEKNYEFNKPGFYGLAVNIKAK